MQRFITHVLASSLFIIGILSDFTIDAQISFGLNSSYRFLKGNEASDITNDWMMPSYVDTLWHIGEAPFHYGDGIGGTELTDMQTHYSSLYLRGQFMVSNASRVESINAAYDYDDGFIIWINGVEVMRFNAPASPAPDDSATAQHESGTLLYTTISTSSLNLKDGMNTIAIQGFNISRSNSSDFYIGISFNASVPLERISQKPIFSKPDMFCDTAFHLTISAPDTAMELLYTLDGSNPEISPTALTGGHLVTLLIDPDSPDHRAVTPAVIVRACLLGKDGFRPSVPSGRTYIFTSKVKTQKFPGGGWPSTTVNTQSIYLPMDSVVVKDPRYADKIDSSLLAIPSISIITDLNNLFNPDTGIYVNALNDGEEWERECSVELINPDQSEGFDVNAGLRIRGGWSRHGENFPKHAFRLFFNAVYGDSKLKFPLFGDEGASEFDKVDLRTSENYGWSSRYSDSEHNTFARETFSRDLQGAMGQPYTRSRYYHLYLNGMYWGLYETQERSEANFASTYFGGKNTDYDVVKVDTKNYTIEATDGTLDSWKQLWDLCGKGFSSNEAYYFLEGKDQNGKPIPGGKVLVNIDNLIDYLLVIFYTGNFDAPYSSFNYRCNNFYGIYNRNSNFGGFTFYAHDNEHTMMVYPVQQGKGIQEDRVNIVMNPPGNISSFQPQWLHYKLCSNEEYRSRFADRAYKYLQPGGLLTPQKCLELFNHRVQQLESPIIAESARWGGVWVSPPYTKDDTWLKEIKVVQNEFFPVRTDILIGQLKKAGLYSNINPPQVFKESSRIYTDTCSFSNSTSITLKDPLFKGNIYYTLDGSDPRLIGGAINPSAQNAGINVQLILNTSAVINCRILSNGAWSMVKTVHLFKLNEDYSNLKVTELMYHPPDVINGLDTIPGSSLEFIELKNTGDYPVNVAGLMLDSAVRCTFPANSILVGGQFFVAASKPIAFGNYYGKEASANFSGNFSNSGEYVLLTDPFGSPLISFTYGDRYPWPGEPDGGGYSLVSMVTNPTGDPANPLYWRPSLYLKGSPFADDDSITSIKPLPWSGKITVYPNPTADIVNIKTDEGMDATEKTLYLYNLNGQKVIEMKFYDVTSISMNEAGLTPGIYILKVTGNNSIYINKVIYNPGRR